MRAQLLVRLGLALVFIWFGIDKFVHPDFWLVQAPKVLQGYGHNFIFLLGLIELVVGLVLLSKHFRWGAFVASGMLAFIIVVVLGFNDVAVRDLGLLLCALSLLIPDERHVSSKSVINLLRGARR